MTSPSSTIAQSPGTAEAPETAAHRTSLSQAKPGGKKCAWAVDGEEIGESDHLPVVITVHTSTKQQPFMGTAPRWRSNSIHFRAEVNKTILNATPSSSPKMRALAFKDAIIAAAHKHVRKDKPGKRTTSF